MMAVLREILFQKIKNTQRILVTMCGVLGLPTQDWRSELGRDLNFSQSINWHHRTKDLVESSHLIMYDTFRVNRDQVIGVETWFKIHTNVSNFETASPKTIYSHICCYFKYWLVHRVFFLRPFDRLDWFLLDMVLGLLDVGVSWVFLGQLLEVVVHKRELVSTVVQKNDLWNNLRSTYMDRVYTKLLCRVKSNLDTWGACVIFASI